MKNIDCGPFLVSGNRRLDYRTIVVPDFIKISDASIIANAAGGDLTENNEAFYREIRKSRVGELTLVFRVIEATFEEMGIEGSGVLKDSFGREISLIEGIIIKELQRDRRYFQVTKEDLDKAHEMIVQPYREFWESTSSQPATHLSCGSLSLSLPQDEDSPDCLEYKIQNPYSVEIAKSDDEAVERPQITISTARSGDEEISESQKWRSTKPVCEYNEVTSVICLQNGKGILTIYDEHEQTIIINNLNLDTGEDTPYKRISAGGCPTAIAISPDGEYMASGVASEVIAREVASEVIEKIPRPIGAIKQLAGGLIKHIKPNIVKLWELTDSQKDPKEMSGNKCFGGIVIAIAFTPDNEILLSGGEDKTIFFWDVKSGGRRGEQINLDSEIRAIAVSPDRNRAIFAVGDDRGKIQFGNWSSTKKTESFIAHRWPINSLAFSPDGKKLVSGGDDGSIKLWDVERGELLKSGQHSAIVTTVAFSPNGKLIASGDDTGVIKIWDSETMEPVDLPKQHDAEVTSLTFSPDGKILASGSKDKTVKIWERV